MACHHIHHGMRPSGSGTPRSLRRKLTREEINWFKEKHRLKEEQDHDQA